MLNCQSKNAKCRTEPVNWVGKEEKKTHRHEHCVGLKCKLQIKQTDILTTDTLTTPNSNNLCITYCLKGLVIQKFMCRKTF